MNEAVQAGVSGELLMIVAICAVVIAGVGLLVGFGMRKVWKELPRGRVAGVEAEPGAAFKLMYTPKDEGKRRVFLRYRLHTKGGPGGLNVARHGLVCDLDVKVGERRVVHETVGFRSDLPRPADREVTEAYNVSEEHTSSDFTQTGTMVLAKLGTCPARAEITIAGRIELGVNTEASLLDVWLGR
jgi:hypothetical protein